MQKGKSKSVSQYKESVRTIQTTLPLKVNLHMLNRFFLIYCGSLFVKIKFISHESGTDPVEVIPNHRQYSIVKFTE